MDENKNPTPNPSSASGLGPTPQPNTTPVPGPSSPTTPPVGASLPESPPASPQSPDEGLPPPPQSFESQEDQPSNSVGPEDVEQNSPVIATPPKKSKTGLIAGISAILLLVISVPLGIILVNQQQEIREKAAVPGPGGYPVGHPARECLQDSNKCWDVTNNSCESLETYSMCEGDNQYRTIQRARSPDDPNGICDYRGTNRPLERCPDNTTCTGGASACKWNNGATVPNTDIRCCETAALNCLSGQVCASSNEGGQYCQSGKTCQAAATTGPAPGGGTPSEGETPGGSTETQNCVNTTCTAKAQDGQGLDDPENKGQKDDFCSLNQQNATQACQAWANEHNRDIAKIIIYEYPYDKEVDPKTAFKNKRPTNSAVMFCVKQAHSRYDKLELTINGQKSTLTTGTKGNKPGLWCKQYDIPASATQVTVSGKWIKGS